MDYRKATHLVPVRKNQSVETLGKMHVALQVRRTELNDGKPTEATRALVYRVDQMVDLVEDELARRRAGNGDAR